MNRKIENPFLYVEVSDRGAELMRIMRKDTGAEILWNGDPAFWSYRSPILFPNVGSTWQKKMKINFGFPSQYAASFPAISSTA